MIDRQKLLTDLQRLLKQLEVDLRERCDVAEIGAAVRAEYESAKAAKRTAQSIEEWRADYITQIGAAWILSCVFARFLEDNQLVEPPKISGPGERLHRARDEYDLYVHDHPADTVREYILSIFDDLARLPGGRDVFGEHNPVQEQRGWISGDSAKALLSFWQQIEPATGNLVHDFTDPNWDTRFLGDLYQDLSEAARKKYALLQTPEFVEAFILERTLEPALEEFSLEPVREGEAPAEPRSGNGSAEASPSRFKMIDPACGSGHFLLGSFRQILDRWQRREPGTNVRELVQRTLDSVHGVDVNPFAIAIARFRLLLAAMQACGIERLADAPAFRLNLVCGDSLLHAPLSSGQQVLDFELAEDSDECDHAYRSENLPELKRMLRGGQYHAVVANPPYITPKDQQLNERYRRRFHSCHMKYSLSVPFLERIFRLTVAGGYTGQITANSFMKREFGKKLIESFFPSVDLTHVIDTSLAYIPGHGTPTVILLGRHRAPVASTIRCVGAIKREDEEPVDPARGLAWSAIVEQVDDPESQSDFVSVGDSPRESFHKHPWSIGGGGAAELKERIDKQANRKLRDAAESVGYAVIVGDDDAYVTDSPCVWKRKGITRGVKSFAVGDCFRDWSATGLPAALYPYDRNGAFERNSRADSHLWPLRAILRNGLFYGQTKEERGLDWRQYAIVVKDKLRRPEALLFAFVATHNNFVFDRQGWVSNKSAPGVKLPPLAGDDDHFALLGLLNSSTGAFWLRQTCHDKGGGGIGGGIAAEAWERFFEYTGTKLLEFPLPVGRPLLRARIVDSLVTQAAKFQPTAVIAVGAPSRDALKLAMLGMNLTRSQMIAAQEELDWECYRLYGLIADDLTLREPPPLQLGQRAFEIVLARKMAAGETQTTWFERHGSTPITDLPAEWPDDYRQLVQRRIALIESDPNIRLIEQPEYKRRWNTEPWNSQLESALREWLLDRLESYFDFDGRMNDGGNATAHASLVEPRLISTAQLADIAVCDANFMQVAELYRDRKDFDATRLVADLIAQESVPLLPVLRYKAAAMDTRAAWERTWEFQRQEDRLSERIAAFSAELEQATDPAERKRLEAEHEELNAKLRELTASIPVPPKYKSSDFQSSDFWRLRGKLDVPKERWVSFPHCEGADQSLVIAWAGYDHLQLAKAISASFADVQQSGGSEDARLIPLLCGILELVPWLKQWHNDVDPTFGYRLGDYFAGFVQDEALSLGKTVDDLKAWRPSSVKKTRKKAVK